MNNKKIIAKKRFGQNFLNDDDIIEKIVSVFKIENENVIEIGPGTGNLSRKLLEKNNKVVAFEIDSNLVELLKEKINQKNFILFEENFLNVDLTPYKNYWIVANIPYYITAEIIFKILEKKQNFHGVVLMVQKEVAERICSEINLSTYSKLSVTCQYYANVKIEFLVDKKMFFPQPKVNSAIISFKFKKNIDYDKDINNFFKLCFSQRRKKLINSLKQKYEKKSVEKVFQALNFSENIRIQEMNIEKIIELYKKLNNM